jgi:hypothetical protein
MTDRLAQMAERIARQTRIDEIFVDPVWSNHVDVPLIELCLAQNQPQVPVILMPELRFKSLLKCLVESLPRLGKVMIVDETNTRFDGLKKSVQKAGLNLYFSAQEVGALNYADNIFHFVLTELGLSTLCRSDVVLPAYRRVLKPEGRLLWSAPTTGSFDAFIDIFEECLFKLCPSECSEIMDTIRTSMTLERMAESIDMSGLILDSHISTNFELEFPNVEQLLFSTLVESHYLGYCLQLCDPKIDQKALLTLLVRAFHHYFQGSSICVPMHMAIFSARKA